MMVQNHTKNLFIFDKTSNIDETNIMFNLGYCKLYNSDRHIQTSYSWRYYNQKTGGGITLAEERYESI